MIETYVLADPRDGRIRYIGKTTVGVDKRLDQHMATADQPRKFFKPGYRVVWSYKEECKSYWLGDLKAEGLRPYAIVIATYNAERTAYEALIASGADLLNERIPPYPKEEANGG